MNTFWQRLNRPPLTTWGWGISALATLALLYLLTLARTPVVGDPSEYTFVAHVLGVAHPPGYAFLTLAGWLWQNALPLGDPAWQMHLLSALAGILTAGCVLGAVLTIGRRLAGADGRTWAWAAAAWAAVTVGLAANFWQHAIHANPHILTAAFMAFDWLALTRWYVTGRRRWLYAFALAAGLGLTHHPLTAFILPACALFLVVARPRLLLEGRTLIPTLAAGLVGLTPWLYFPLRSPALADTQFPSQLDTLEGFLNLILARGLRVNLFHFGWADQLDRLTVFGSLLRLQYSLPLLFLALVGLVWLARRRPAALPPWAGGATRSRPWWPLLLLYSSAGLLLYGFVINSVQDVMAYLLGPFVLVGLLAGVGLAGLLAELPRRWPQTPWNAALLALVLLLGPGWQLARHGAVISLRHYQEGAAYLEAVWSFFQGQGEGAVLLNDWERMTPLWYAQLVEKRWPDPADVRPVYVSSARPWLEHLFEHLPAGPVYLNGFRREIFEAGFRLRPRGPFYQVVEPGDVTLPPELIPLTASAGPLELLGYQLPAATQAGDRLRLVLALRAPQGTTDVYAPVLQVGPLTFAFTTDSHLLSTAWLPGEVIVEAFDLALPATLPAGPYPLTLRLHNLSANQDAGLALSLGTLDVAAQPFPQPTDGLLANFQQQVGLVSATARLDGRRAAPWSEPIQARVGDTLHLTLEWESLAPAEHSYTVFVHLIDWSNRPVVDNLDYTPLGGAAPTHLWIAKWLPGQRYRDPYRMSLAGVPPGDYLVEVGLYQMTSRQRLLIADPQGNMTSDRYILGPVIITPAVRP